MGRPALVTPEQVASEMQISMRTFYRRVKDGSIPAFKMGSLWRCPASYLENFRGDMGNADKLSPRIEVKDESQTQISAGRPYTM